MKRKTVLIVISIILSVVILAAGGLGITYAIFRSEGLHHWGQQISVNFDEPCYLYDVGTQTFLEDSTFSWDIWLNKACQNPKPEHLTIEGYPPIGNVGPTMEVYTYYEPDNMLFWHSVTYQYGPWPTGEEAGTLADRWVGRMFKVIYDIDNDRIGVQITNGDNDDLVIAFVGFASQADALAYLENPYGSQLLEYTYYEHRVEAEA